MAKNTQEAEVIVTMNGTAAKKAVAELTQEYERLTKEALEARKAGNEALGKELDAKAQKLMKDVEITRRETKKFADVMKNINGASLKELRSAAKQLQSEINKLTPGTQAFITKSKQLQEVNTRIRQLTTSFKGLTEEEKRSTLTMKGLADSFNKYFGIVTTGIATVTGLSMAFRKAAEDAAKMDDAYAQVRKTTGLTSEEVRQLNEAFKKMDTRTSREELNRTAYEAGKLGFTGVENIRQFVEAADVINVALGDVLGEGATLEIAKLSQVFAQSTQALDGLDLKGRMMAVGSAINQLGKESTASESYMVDFLGRLGGVATQAGISADQILGYASALDQMKQKVEMSATAFQKMIQQMIKKPEEFVEAARMPLEEFKKLMETDMNAAIKRVLEGFNEMGGFQQLVPVFKDMGLDGARAASVIASLASNLDKVSEAQATANEHIKLGTSMTREYNIMNESRQAQLEKARKQFKDAAITLGESLNPIMLKSTKITTHLIRLLAEYGKEIRNAAIAVAALTVVIKLNTIAQGLGNAAMKIGNALRATGNTIIWAARVAYYKLIGATEAATIAQAQLNAVMSASVIGVVALAVGGLTAAITHWVKKTKEANTVAEKMVEIEKTINSEYIESASRVKALSNIVHNNNIELNERKRALDELKGIVPDYHADLLREGQLINDNSDALKEYLKNLEKATRAKVLNEEYEKAIAGVLEAEKELEKAKAAAEEENIKQGGSGKTKRTTITATGPGSYSRGEELTEYGKALNTVTEKTDALSQAQRLQLEIEQQINKEMGKRERELSAQEKEIKAIEEKYEQLFNEAKNAYVGAPEEGVKAMGKLQEKMNKEIAEIRKKYAQPENLDGGGGGGGSSTSKESPYKQALKDLQDAQREEENDLKEHYLNNQLTTEEYQKQMRLINLNYLVQKVELASKYGEDEKAALAAWLDAEIAATEAANKEIDALLKQREDWEQAQLEEAENYKKRMEELAEEAKKIRERIDPSAARLGQMQDELANLNKLHAAKFLSEEEYEKAVKEMRKRYADEDLQDKLGNVSKYLEKANSLFSEASNFVSSLKEAESAKMEAEYQKQLTAAGDNAEQRETIEAEYEQKKLDLQKQYADADMAINIAKTVANGAAAAVRAFADSGWVAGSIIAAMIAASTAAEVATIVAQRNAIKNTSLNNSGSSNSSGQRVIAGYAGGGYTEDHTTFTTVGEEGTEWIAPHWMVSQNPVTFRNLEQYRRAGSHGRSGSVSRGFAEGGFTDDEILAGKMSGFLTKQEIEAAVETAIVRAMANRAIRAYLVRKDLTELDNQDARLKAITSLG